MPCHRGDIPVCPHLPAVSTALRAVSIREAGEDRGEIFYETALRCAHSLARQGLPAQAILMLNRAFAADLRGSEEILVRYPLPYAAMRWTMETRAEVDFIGNPRRHFQHLATRMVEPRRERRTARAWACWQYAKRIFPEFPADDKQLAEEGIAEPSFDAIAEMLDREGLPGETDLWRKHLPPVGYSSRSSASESLEL